MKTVNMGVEILRTAIEKNAGFWQGFKSSLSGKNIGHSLGSGMTEGIASAAMAGLGEAVSSGITALADKVRKPMAFKAMVEASPSLKKMDQKAVQMTFNTLHNLNPQLARDPLTAASFVARSITRADMGGQERSFVDVQTAKDLQRGGQEQYRPVRDSFRSGRPSLPETPRPMPPGKDYTSESKLERYKAQLRSSRRPSAVKPPF
jgi:hypothetical protein